MVFLGPLAFQKHVNDANDLNGANPVATDWTDESQELEETNANEVSLLQHSTGLKRVSLVPSVTAASGETQPGPVTHADCAKQASQAMLATMETDLNDGS